MAERSTLNRRVTLFSSMSRKRHAAAMTAGRLIPVDCIRIHLLQHTREPLDKVLTVRVIFKYRFAFDPSIDDMMQDAGGIYASSAKHVIQYGIVNLLYTLKQRPFVLTWSNPFDQAIKTAPKPPPLGGSA